MQTAGLTNDYRSRSLPTEEAHEEQADQCSRFFKVLKVEYPKFFTMAFLYYSIVLAYSILRDTKDAVVMDRMLPASIQYLKSFIVIAATMSFAILFQFLLSRGVTLEKLMFVFNMSFGIFFLVYALILLPSVDYIEPYKFWIHDIFADKKMFINGLASLEGLFLTINFWTGTLLYISAELWGNVMTSVMFFAVANEICPLKQALRFYPLFIIGANLGLITSGGFMVSNYYLLKTFPQHKIKIISAFVTAVSGLCLINVFTYRHLVRNIIPYPIYIVSEARRSTKSKEKVGIIDGFKIMFKTPIVLHLSITVLGYGLCTNLTEAAFKSAVRESSKKSGEDVMTNFVLTQGLQQLCIGLLVIAILFSPVKSLIQKKGWLALGMFTPVLSLISATSFLLFVWANASVTVTGKDAENLLNRFGKRLFTLIGWTAMTNAEYYFGFLAVNTIKILKYAAFDIGKEAIGVKIPKQYKARFKGVYDGVCGKLGKSLSSNVQIVILGLLNLSDIRTASLLLLITVVLVATVWSMSTLYLGRRYDEAVREDRDLYIGETEDAKTAAQLKKESKLVQ
ncbi:ATP:ADP antiporter, AAA family [Nematocida minor]|uniref:ATP:ADP antiporter, AAA family n=1 Tax=Nematocida minor TaxID=1912983 RepID=UPI0022207E53|nr:ATP:ADP antiporter, AAA family [Nematocida minor]KAI5191976.1 ATP:ADP antiporter, AAA family [Nematocida minor]